MNTEVIIVGGGISGLVLSILLKEKNINHVVLDRVEKRKGFEFPETIPPSTLVLLESLNLLELFAKSSCKTYGYHSLWKSDTLNTDNFFQHNPFKYGLKLNKKKLLLNLSERVKENIVFYQSLIKLKRTNKSISVEIKTGQAVKRINCRIIVDATGRNRAILKRLGIKSKSFDDQVALSCHQPFFKHPKTIHQVYTELFEHGWGIVSSLNEQTNVISLYTDKGSSILPLLNDYRNWKSVLSDTTYLKDFLVDGANRKVIGAEANSSRASQISGSNWLAIGDAAIAFDPISSHGNSNAIYSANLAANKIVRYLKNNLTADWLYYEDTISRIFNTYLYQRNEYYDLNEKVN